MVSIKHCRNYNQHYLCKTTMAALTMKFWQMLSFNDPREMTALAQGAEAAGFDGVLLSEHLFVPENYENAYPYTEDGKPTFTHETLFPDPWVCFASMAAVTSHLRFCTMVQILPLHHPLEIAKTLATLSLLTNNRVILGTGAGWMKEEFDVMGADFSTRGKRYDEAIDIMRKLWQGGFADYRGEIFDLPSMCQSPAPEQEVPIFIGGTGKAALRRAATRGNGWIGQGNTAAEVEAMLFTIQELRKEVGREHEPFETIVPLVEQVDGTAMAKLIDLGLDGVVSYPFNFMLGPDASLQQKLDMMKTYGEKVIAPARRGRN